LRDEEIGALATELSPSQACRALVHLANLRGGGDNCTVTIVRIGDLPANVPLPELPTAAPPEPMLEWSWLALGWAAAIAFALGMLLIVFQRPVAGGVFTALSAAGFVVLIRAILGRRRSQPIDESDLSRTNYWRPYRTAVIRSMQELFDDLGVIEASLSRAAREEGWSVRWSQHSQAIQAASEAKGERRFGRGVRDYCRAIDLLMTPLYAQRREAKDAAAS